MEKSTLKIAICLGILSAIGPLGIDMYLPALPRMSRDLAATSGSMQLSVMSFFVGFTLGQLFHGPISDKIGRKRMIYIAMSIFVLASFGCIFAENVSQLILSRFAQGFGGAAGMVLSAAVVRDLYTGQTAARLMASIIVVLGSAPVVAPLLGSMIVGHSSWKMVFVTLAATGLFGVMITSAILPETRTPELRASSRPSAALRNYWNLLMSRKFIPYAGALAFAQGGFFAYVSGSSFFLITVHGLSPMAYSLLFGLNAIGIGIGSVTGARFIGRFSGETVVKTATLVYSAASIGLLLLELFGKSGLWPVSILLFIIVTCIGSAMPSCNMLALESHGAISGTAAALIGAMGFGSGAVASALVGAFDKGDGHGMITVIALCGILAAIVANFAFEKSPKESAIGYPAVVIVTEATGD